MTDLVFTLPDKSTPGYLRRQEQALVFYTALKGDPDPTIIREMVNFLVDYVDEPADTEEAKEALMDASEDEFNLLFNAVMGKSDDEENPTKPRPRKKKQT